MINDCLSGKIDYIITKSVSRFARNTVDCLDHVRMLRARGIGIYFEEQNIDTLQIDSELYLDYHAGALSKEKFDAASETISAKWRECQQELAVHSAVNGGPDMAMSREEMDTLTQLSNLRSLDREIVDRLIRTIRIFENRRIEIVWNFSSPYAALIEGYERKDNHEGNK